MKTFYSAIFKTGLAILPLLFLLASCNKANLEEAPEEEIKIDSPFLKQVVDATINYDYYGTTYSVTYTYDQATDEILDRKGDLDKIEALFEGRRDYPVGFLYDMTDVDVTGEVNLQIFDTNEEVDEALGRAIPRWDPCQYYEGPGSATYRYYEHINYSTEMWDLTKSNKGHMGWNYVMDHNNDKMSSLKIVGNGDGNNTSIDGYIQCWTDWCWGGYQYTFTTKYGDLVVPNMVLYQQLAHSGMAVTQPYQGFPGPGLNDKISSIRARWYY